MDGAHARSILRVAFLALLIWTPLPFGAVETGAVYALELHAALVGLLSLWILARERTVLPATARRALALTAIVLAVGAIQLIPLPGSVTALLAPQAHEARTLLAPVLGIASAPSPISIEPLATVDALLRFVAYLLIALAAAVALDTPARLRRAAWILALSGAFQALYGATEYLSGHQHIFWYAKRFYTDEASGTFINRNHFATYLAATLPFALALALRPRQAEHPAESWRERGLRLLEPGGAGRVTAGLAAASIWIGVVLSYSRAGLAVALAATVTFAVLAARGRIRTVGRLAAVLVLLPTIVLLFQEVRAPGERFVADEEDLRTFGGRIEVWRAGLGMAADHPVLGTGLGTFEAAFAPLRPPGVELRWTHVHSDWLEAAIEGGLLTLAAMIAIFLLVGHHVLRGAGSPLTAALAASVVALALHATVDFPLRIPALAVVAAVVLGTALRVEVRSEAILAYPRRS
jgi:putative inorganic carbon (hco3(-)) transporter